MSDLSVGTAPIARGALLGHIGILAAGSTLVQVLLALAGGSMGLVPLAGLFLLAGYLAWFQIRRAKALRQRAYAGYLVHVSAFLLVSGGFWLHALLRGIDASAAGTTADWGGFLVVMPLGWGAGLLVHTVGTLLSHGFDDVSI